MSEQEVKHIKLIYPATHTLCGREAIYLRVVILGNTPPKPPSRLCKSCVKRLKKMLKVLGLELKGA